ncbi:MAG: biotin carboxylase N-terminal domain-containing protein, partial [Paludibacter sp.]|nr:biotin carboxylase N-terminal domain-containing protein [Paludibacter sp.]
MKKKLLIANRSEIAIRIIRSAHKLGMLAVVFQSDKEPDALYLKYADEIIAAKDNGNEKSIFLDADRIVKLALENNIDLIHPGYGFLSENPDFAELCVSNGINFIGPSPQLIRDMGLKTVAKSMAIEAGLPLVPGSDGPVKDAKAAKEFADKIGYPVILKAS